MAAPKAKPKKPVPAPQPLMAVVEAPAKAPQPQIIVVQEESDDIDRFTKFVNRIWRPWLGFIILVGWTWQIVTVHVAPFIAQAFWHYTLPKFEGYNADEIQWLVILTGAIFLGKGIEKMKGKSVGVVMPKADKS